MCWVDRMGWRYCSSNWRNNLVHLGAINCIVRKSAKNIHSVVAVCGLGSSVTAKQVVLVLGKQAQRS